MDGGTNLVTTQKDQTPHVYVHLSITLFCHASNSWSNLGLCLIFQKTLSWKKNQRISSLSLHRACTQNKSYPRTSKMNLSRQFVYLFFSAPASWFLRERFHRAKQVHVRHALWTQTQNAYHAIASISGLAVKSSRFQTCCDAVVWLRSILKCTVVDE